MRKLGISVVLLLASIGLNHAQSFENKFSKSLSTVLHEIGDRFDVRFKYNVDTTGLDVPYADFRIRPYSVEESLTNVLAMFDFKFVKEAGNTYKIKGYEYPRRTAQDGEKMLAYLNTLYNDSLDWNLRKESLRKEVREKLHIDDALNKRVNARPVLSKIRKYNGYSVQNFALETLPGLYVNGSIYSPLTKGKHPLILCPNGHWSEGRYNSDCQLRYGTLARMGATCVTYDLFGWGESGLQVSYAAHQTSEAHIIQILNGITLLDYMLSRIDIDVSKVGANGGSGGGAQVVLLTLLDDRFTAACPTVSLASHFDGGCPCESGMPISLACGGTNNAELMATFAPKPLCVVSDGQDWTASVPELEFPYLQGIYKFYHAENMLSNVHLPDEGHSFGINKRTAVYDFFINYLGLKGSMLDESKVVVEKKEAMFSFGVDGEKMPANAIRDFSDLEKFFNKKRNEKVNSKIETEKRSQACTESLNLNNKEKEARVKVVIYKHMLAVREWNNAHPHTLVPEGINPLNGKALTKLDREVIANASKPKSVHEDLMSGLRKDLNEEQVEQVLDFYTIGKVAFTMKAYHVIVTDMTDEEEKVILSNLKEAREMAVDYKSMKQISAIFEIYKTKNEQYLNSNGRSWRGLYKAYVKSVKANKAKSAKSKKK